MSAPAYLLPLSVRKKTAYTLPYRQSCKRSYCIVCNTIKDKIYPFIYNAKHRHFVTIFFALFFECYKMLQLEKLPLHI